jgi:hypothetical protein
MLAVVFAANLVLFPLKLLLLGWRPSHPEAAMFLAALLGGLGVAVSVGYVFVRNVWRDPPRTDDAAPLGWGEWLGVWALVAFAVFFTPNWLFGPGLMPSRYGGRVKT